MNTRKILDLPLATNPQNEDYLILGKSNNALERVPISYVMGTKTSLINSNSVLDPNIFYLVDTSGGALTLTLPVAAFPGEWVGFADFKGSNPENPTGFGKNTLTIVPASGDTVQNETNLVLDQENQAVSLAHWGGNWTITYAAV